MKENKSISSHSKAAASYDDQVKDYDSYGHDVMFGMCYEFVKPNELLLDIGIGTGLASINFSKIGLKVYGLDGSEEMLSVCKSKMFTEELKLYDFSNSELPFENNFFHHVISCGVFHFFDDLSKLFKEIKRVIKNNGIFAFTIAPSNLLPSESDYLEYVSVPTGWGVSINKHSMAYINDLLVNNGFELLKEQRVLLKDADKQKHNMEFSVLKTRCKEE